MSRKWCSKRHETIGMTSSQPSWIGSGSRSHNNSSICKSSSGKSRRGTIVMTVILTSIPSFLLGSFVTLNVLAASASERFIQTQQERCEKCSCPKAKKVNPVPSKSALLDTEHYGNFLHGITQTPKKSFMEAIDLGVPVEGPEKGADYVVLLHSRDESMPLSARFQKDKIADIPNAQDAIANCDYLHIILHPITPKRDTCLAIVPQYPSFLVHRYMRLADSTIVANISANETKIKASPKRNTNNKIDRYAPLQLVGRGTTLDGWDQNQSPNEIDRDKSVIMLRNYLVALDDVLADLKPILEKIAIDNTVIVMVCNFGQSELLMNFCCAARAHGLESSVLRRVLVFATDMDAYHLASELGLAVYYDHRNFADFSPEAARRYGDRRFTAMMMAKALVVQYVSALGYDLLFSDVDVILFHDPIQYFRTRSELKEFDIIFQDDGAHSSRYAPYAANSGFYYVRNNPKTRHLLNTVVLQADMVFRTDSHQQVLANVLNDHASLRGLRVKVISRDNDDLPGGYHYHQRTGKYLRRFFKKEVDPIVFHMSWTENKDNKLLFLRQMGEWYVRDQCVGRKAEDIPDANITGVSQRCCSMEALVSCHYRDKPSVRSCHDAPAIDGRPSWWTGDSS